ncbi:MAG TPA: hypothetical protein EYG81_00940, partial [Archaeoglobus profundus]|nr:hypothetical protein [Archaeoglobus profundus]
MYLRSDNENHAFTIQTEFEKVKLCMLWKAIMNDIDVQNSTANLQWLHLKVSDNKIQSLHLEF